MFYNLINVLAGDIHIWDRVSAVLLHHIRAQEVGGDLTCIAWNPAAENPFMFGTGSHDGAVRIWSSPPNPDTSPQEPSNPPRRQGKRAHDLNTETPSPFDSDVEYHRTDSPVAELESESRSHTSENGRGSSRERTIAFVH